ncbi:MAG: hypothetical protein PHR82_06785 [Endomicrobiaceae bacterium]|nr:hypothetical protein [Endomicrobiaceae bacterium]
MTGFLIDILLIVLLLFFFYIGFKAGIVRSFFAVTAGFIAIILAENYPYQVGINYYLIFCVSAVSVYLTGLFFLRLVNFMFLSFFDKLAGSCLAVLIWFILSANCIIPSLTDGNNKLETKIVLTISRLSSKTFPSFGKYKFDFNDVAKLREANKYILYKKELL